MTEETEQEIAKRIYILSTQIENIKATQLNTEQLTAVIRSANAQVRHIQRQQNELSTDEFQQACEVVKDTAEKLDYWESRYKLVLDIMEEWDKDFIQLKADYEMLSEADGKTNKDAEYWKQKCIDINNDYIQLNKALSESNQKLLDLRSNYIDLQAKYEKLNTINTALERAEYNYKAISQNLEKVNAECEAWKQRYQELNKKFDNNAVKFTDAKLKADAVAMSYDELFKENQQLYATLDEKEDQLDGLFKEAKLLTETKVSLVSELLDLKYLIHKLRLDDETPEDVTNADDINETES